MADQDPGLRIDADRFLQQSLASAFAWYQQADSKAQTVLGFTGIFLGILAAPLLVGSKASLGLTLVDTVLLFLTIVTASVGIVLSVAALWSRGMFKSPNPGIQFFGFIAEYATSSELLDEVKRTTSADYLVGLSDEVFQLCRNTKRKHRLVDVAAVFSGLALLSVVLLIVSALLFA